MEKLRHRQNKWRVEGRRARMPQRWGWLRVSGIHPGPSVRLSSSSKEREREGESSDGKGDQANGARFSYQSSGRDQSFWHPSKKLEPLLLRVFCVWGTLLVSGMQRLIRHPETFLRGVNMWERQRTHLSARSGGLRKPCPAAAPAALSTPASPPPRITASSP